MNEQIWFIYERILFFTIEFLANEWYNKSVIMQIHVYYWTKCSSCNFTLRFYAQAGKHVGHLNDLWTHHLTIEPLLAFFTIFNTKKISVTRSHNVTNHFHPQWKKTQIRVNLWKCIRIIARVSSCQLSQNPNKQSVWRGGGERL